MYAFGRLGESGIAVNRITESARENLHTFQVRVVGREVGRWLLLQLLFLCRTEPDRKSACDLTGDARLHVKHIGEIGVVLVLPARQCRTAGDFDELRRESNAA